MLPGAQRGFASQPLDCGPTPTFLFLLLPPDRADEEMFEQASSAHPGGGERKEKEVETRFPGAGSSLRDSLRPWQRPCALRAKSSGMGGMWSSRPTGEPLSRERAPLLRGTRRHDQPIHFPRLSPRAGVDERHAPVPTQVPRRARGGAGRQTTVRW
jgi:hypothetical protein